MIWLSTAIMDISMSFIRKTRPAVMKYCFRHGVMVASLGRSLSGSMLPFVLKRAKLDPATSSAPFVATLVDVTGLIIYFSVAYVVLKGTLL